MTNIRLLPRSQALTGLLRDSGARVTLTPTRAALLGDGVVLLPQPMSVDFAASDPVLTNVTPCDGTQGWCWELVIERGGRDAWSTFVLVPDVATVDVEDLQQVDPRTLLSVTDPVGEWKALLDDLTAAAGNVPDGAQQLSESTFQFTRRGAPLYGTLVLPRGPEGLPGTNATPSDEAVGAYLGSRTSQTGAIADALYGRATLAAAMYGVGPTRTGAQNKEGLLLAKAAADPFGLAVQLPEGRLDFNGEIALGATEVYGLGHRTVIHPAQKPMRTFVLDAPNGHVHSMRFEGDGLDMAGTTKVAYQDYCGVRILPGAHGSRVHDISGKDIYIVVRLGGEHNDGGTIPPGQAPIDRLSIYNIECDGVWSGVFGGTFTNMFLDGVTGTYRKAFRSSGSTPDIAPPPHLIYLYSPDLRTDDGANTWDTSLRNVGLTLGPNMRATGCLDSEGGYAAFALKFVDGITGTVAADNCPGVLDIIGCQDSSVTATVTRDRYPSSGTESARASVAIKNSRWVTVDGDLVKAVGNDGRAVFTESTAVSCTIGLNVTTYHTTENLTASAGDIRIAGVGNTFRGRLHGAGSAAWNNGVLVVPTGRGARIVDPSVSGRYRRCIRVENHPGTLVDYEPMKVQPDYSLAGAEALSIITGMPTAVRDRSLGQGRPGFSADFSVRANALALALTDDGKPLVPNATSGGRCIIDSGAAVPSNVGGALYEVADAGTADGTFTAVIAALNDAAGGLVIRYLDNANQLMLQTRVSAGDLRYRLVKRVGNALSTVATSSTAPAVGDTVAVTLSGTSVTVRVNGVDIFGGAQIVSDHATATRHGIYGASGSLNTAWRSLLAS